MMRAKQRLQPVMGEWQSKVRREQLRQMGSGRGVGWSQGDASAGDLGESLRGLRASRASRASRGSRGSRDSRGSGDELVSRNSSDPDGLPGLSRLSRAHGLADPFANSSEAAAVARLEQEGQMLANESATIALGLRHGAANTIQQFFLDSVENGKMRRAKHVLDRRRAEADERRQRERAHARKLRESRENYVERVRRRKARDAYKLLSSVCTLQKRCRIMLKRKRTEEGAGRKTMLFLGKRVFRSKGRQFVHAMRLGKMAQMEAAERLEKFTRVRCAARALAAWVEWLDRRQAARSWLSTMVAKRACIAIEASAAARFRRKRETIRAVREHLCPQLEGALERLLASCDWGDTLHALDAIFRAAHGDDGSDDAGRMAVDTLPTARSTAPRRTAAASARFMPPPGALWAEDERIRCVVLARAGVWRQVARR